MEREEFIPSLAYSTRMTARFIPILAAVCLLFTGCHSGETTDSAAPMPQNEAAAPNALFLNQKTFDPWVLAVSDQENGVPFYASNGEISYLLSDQGAATAGFRAGSYQNGQLQPLSQVDLLGANDYGIQKDLAALPDRQRLDMRTGQFLTRDGQGNGVVVRNLNDQVRRDWPHLWQTSDIVITGDPEAQQVTHANLFYLLSSTYPGSDYSIPPFGLSSNLYGGHIFWDAEVFMLPALIVQHPEYAKPIVDYRFKLLGQAKKNAAAHGLAGAEYPWESADTGKELVGGEFAKERHITADVGWAAWQYYLWTGDKTYLKTEGWPLLSATAAYWVSRVSKGTDGKYHIKDVLGPDETDGVVNDDAWTNGVVQANLEAAAKAAKTVGQTPDPRWASIAAAMYFPQDAARGIPAENSKPLTGHFAAKQADTVLRAYPLGQMTGPATVAKTLDFYAAHTIKTGPAMTASMEAILAARLGRGPSSLDLFHDSYRPFIRGPWDAFAEKRTSNRVYFCTGMGGCLQSILYGFAGLNLNGLGTQITGELYADPHLPPGWNGLTIKGVKYHGKTYDVAIAPGNKVTVKSP